MGIKLRIPTNKEYERLIELTGGDDTKMHGNHMMSWVNDKASGDNLTVLLRSNRISYYHENYNEARASDIGFRPACRLSSMPMVSIQDGESLVMGTLYMAGKPVKVPKNPTYDGDITAYAPRAALELRKPLEDPDYQVTGYRVGRAAVADRCLLNGISGGDLRLLEFFESKDGFLTLPSVYCTNFNCRHFVGGLCTAKQILIIDGKCSDLELSDEAKRAQDEGVEPEGVWERWGL